MNLTIKSKLFGSYTIILALLISMAVFVSNKLSESNERLLNAVNVSSKRISLSNELMIAVLEAARHEKNIIMENDPVKKDYYKDRIYQELVSIDKKTYELQDLLDENGKLLLAEFKTTWSGYKTDLNEIILLAMKNEDEKAFEISINKGLHVRDAAISQLGRLVNKNEKIMESVKSENNASYNSTLNLIIALVLTSILVAIIISYWIVQSTTKRILTIAHEAEKIANRESAYDKPVDKINDELKPIFNALVSINESFREVTENANNVASGVIDIELTPRSDNDILGIALNKMTRSLREKTSVNEKQIWLTAGQNQLNEKLLGNQSIEALASTAINFLCTYLKANIGAIYHLDDVDNTLKLIGQYAFSSYDDTKVKFALNEGIIGQAAQEQKQISISDITEDQLRITSSVLNAKPKNVLITPFLFEGKTVGVIEIGRLTDFNDKEKKFINVAMDSIAVSMNTAINQQSLKSLLHKVQTQKSEMEKTALELDQQVNSLNQAAIVSIADANGNIIYVNDKFCKVSKYAKAELLGKNHSILKSGKQPEGLFVGMWKSISVGRVWNGEILNKAKDGTFYWVDTTISPFIGIDGKIEKYVAIRFEITNTKNQMQELAQQSEEKEKRAAELAIANKELAFQNDEKEKRAAELGLANKELAFQDEEKGKRAEELNKVNQQLKTKERQLSNQINAIAKSNATIEFDLNGNILAVNDSFLNITGYTENEVLGKHHSLFVDEEYAKTKEYHQFWESLKKGEYKKDEFKRLDKNGEIIWLLGSYNPILDISGKPFKVLKIATDVTLVKKQILELAQQSEEKEKRAAELIIANKELAFQNDEKEKRASELGIANKELAFQAEELQVQQEELKQMNEELEEQSHNLKQQQEELQMSNEELEEQTQSLEEKNKEVEAAKYDIEQKTKQLEVSSRYKSEFLANMSHELRTPLNSLLILSKDLSENKKKNLDSIEVESAEIVYKSGLDLLVLINEVLDLSKIEAGKMLINIESISLKYFSNELIRNFKHQAEQKGLKLTCKLDKDLPEVIRTDSQRLNQILKNLISNALKFTEKGSVRISISPYKQNLVIISIADTGIGIQEDKQMAIFEAFQQAEGGTSRKYGGTGLGLSISRELAKLLGAEIKLTSKLKEGSTFSLIIPLEIRPELQASDAKESILYKPLHDSFPIAIGSDESDTKYLNYPSIKDNRDTITTDDKVVLIIEDDLKFASILLKQANQNGFKCLSVATGEDGLMLAKKYKPQAIILDMELPGINGHKVLLELKSNPLVRHIPVHIISSNERSLEPIKEGAIEYLMKPVDKKDLEKAFKRIENFVSRKIKNLLIIEDNENSRKAMRILIGNGDVKCFEAGTGTDALALYKQNHIDCIILDIGLPDMSGYDLIHKLVKIKDHSIPPIIVYTGKELTKEENTELQKYAETIIIKGVKSEERLLDETALFLHRTIGSLPKSKQSIINNLYDKESVFHEKKILLVDDDMRNVFALSKILEERGIEIIKADNGKNALEMLDTHPDIDLVLMDIMMPEMDGYEAMKRIRSQTKFKNLPVIALTAKAMKDDKQKCIEAGANDYITKPIDVERLLSLMRVWLSK